MESQLTKTLRGKLVRVRPLPRRTPIPIGWSNWHLLAMGILTDVGAAAFLQAAKRERHDVLIDDLRESTWLELDDTYGWDFEARHGIPLRAANPFLIHRNVEELCRLARVPLFGYYAFYDLELPMVVRGFNRMLMEKAHAETKKSI